MATMQFAEFSEPDYVYRPGGLYKKWAVYFGISFAAHAILLVLLLFMPDGKGAGDMAYRFESMDVRLVSLGPDLPPPSSGGGGDGGDFYAEEPVDDGSEASFAEGPAETAGIPVKSGAASRPESSSSDLVLPEQLRESEPAVKEAASPRFSDAAGGAQRNLVTPDELRRQDQQRSVADSVKRLERQTGDEDRRRASVRRRVDQLEGEMAGAQRPRRGQAASGTGAAGSGGRSRGGSTENWTRLQIYQAEVRSVLKSNWVFAENLAGDTSGLETRVVMKIMPDGEITDVWFEKRSGNSYLDDSAYRTVMKSDPLPPLPDDTPHYHLIVGFTPGGLR